MIHQFSIFVSIWIVLIASHKYQSIFTSVSVKSLLLELENGYEITPVNYFAHDFGKTFFSIFLAAGLISLRGNPQQVEEL